MQRLGWRHTCLLSVYDPNQFAEVAHNHPYRIPINIGRGQCNLIVCKAAHTGSFRYAGAMVRESLFRDMYQEL